MARFLLGPMVPTPWPFPRQLLVRIERSTQSMLKKLALVIACAGISAVAVRAADPTVYENVNNPYYIFNSSGPAAVPVLDDGHLADPGGDTITDFKFAFSVPNLGTGATVDFDALITFYTGTPINTPFVTAKSPANTLASYRLQFRGVDASAVHLFTSPTVASNFTIPTQDFAVEYLFVSPDGVDVNDVTDVAAPLIATGGPTVGSSADFMYTDDSLDGKYDAATAPTYFGDGVHNASIYLRLHGTPLGSTVPEPGTLALLGSLAPLAGIVIRRKRA
jgi:hypothetical protein